MDCADVDGDLLSTLVMSQSGFKFNDSCFIFIRLDFLLTAMSRLETSSPDVFVTDILISSLVSVQLMFELILGQVFSSVNYRSLN